MSGTAAAPKDGRGFWGALAPILSFVGTGLGLLGFVIFFGGFVLWTRFDAVGLPADDAVARVPRGTLVTTGASFLVPALLAAAFPVALAIVSSDAVIGNWRRRRAQRGGSAEPRTVRLGDHEVSVIRLAQLGVGLVPVLVFDAFYVVQTAGSGSGGKLVLVLLAIVTSIAIAVVVLSVTNHFGWFAVAVFLGLCVVVAFSTYARTYGAPKLEPVAAVAGQAPVDGLFVAEASDALYLGRPPAAGEDPVLVRVPKASISALAIGAPMRLESAYRHAAQMVDALCHRTVILRAATDKAPRQTGPACDAALR